MNVEKLKEKITLLTKDLLFSSESDYPFEILFWKEVSKQNVRAYISTFKDYGDLISENSAHDFFKKIIYNLKNSGDDAVMPIADRYENLYDFMKENTTALAVWRCGRIEIDIYITMEVSTGGMMVLKTISVET
jgi:hypothetical protein